MSTTFSVLLPTRNGGKYLENCIRSILDQMDDDVELIVSDNANTDETPSILDKYRSNTSIRILRTEQPLSVTDNWNNALHAAQGEYILMMGDDDYLLPGYFDALRDIVFARHGKPDCVLYNGYSYIAPASIANDPVSYYSNSHFEYDRDFDKECELSRETCRGIVRDMFSFHVRIPLNMQTTLVRRDAGRMVPGGMFQAPFPDHFALNSLLLAGARWVFTPRRLVIVGVSPKSFGHYVYSNQQGAGLAYLGINATFPGQLPGNELLNGMHIWLNKLSAAFPAELQGARVDRAAYVRRQVYAWIMQWRLGTASAHDLISRLRLLSARDWGGVSATLFDSESWRRVWRFVAGRGGSDAEQQWHGLKRIEDVKTIAEFSSMLVKNGEVGRVVL